VRVVPLEVEDAHHKVFGDPLVEQVVEVVHAHRPLLAFLTSTLRDYRTASALKARNPSLRKLAAAQGAKKAERGALDRLCTAIERLYVKHDPSIVRGVIVEALVQRSIQPRYGGAADMLENNLRFRVEDGSGNSHETSTSIDVIGVCSSDDAGECIDCKVASKAFKPSWVEELTDRVAPFGFRIGLATTDSPQTARRRLKNAGIEVGGNTSLITPETWALPLLT
jgi:hypothetical protein